MEMEGKGVWSAKEVREKLKEDPCHRQACCERFYPFYCKPMDIYREEMECFIIRFMVRLIIHARSKNITNVGIFLALMRVRKYIFQIFW